MRLVSLEVSGFRGFSTDYQFDLDAEAIIVVGANGNGKTSLFDAILWAISGKIPRLSNDDVTLLSRFSETGQARVALRLRKSVSHDIITITRVFDGSDAKVSIESPEGTARGLEAEHLLAQLIWKEAALATNSKDALANVLTRSVYLQQDLVREFIDSTTQQQRFATVSELVGAGRVTELQVSLERAKAAWSKTTNTKTSESQPLRTRLANMESRLGELRARSTTSNTPLADVPWNEWWNELHFLGLTLARIPIESRDAAGVIDSVIKQLEAIRRATERRKQLLDELHRDITVVAAQPRRDLTPLRERPAFLRTTIQETRDKVAAEQKRSSELRRLQTELVERSEQLRALAVLALQHLGDNCPVCGQVYDIDTTRRRLEAVANQGPAVKVPMEDSQALDKLLSSLAVEEAQLAAAERELQIAEQSARESESLQIALNKRIADLGIENVNALDAATSLSTLSSVANSASLQIDRLILAQKQGEEFALQLARAGEQAAVIELQSEIDTTRKKLHEVDQDSSRRNATGNQAQRIIEALRDAASTVVTEQIKGIEPLLTNFYGRIDVHPAFRGVRFLASVVRGHGQLSAAVSDPLSEIESDLPGTVLSSSQMNALAVCVFLALNLGISRPPLETAMLDDPLQSLDDINLLGLIDLLRQTKEQRQLCVSTHDIRFGNLLARKLRPKTPTQKTLVIELDGWTRKGPSVIIRKVESDPAPMRLTTAQ